MVRFYKKLKYLVKKVIKYVTEINVYKFYAIYFYLNIATRMGNKLLRPSEEEPLAGFNDDQICYLKDKF